MTDESREAAEVICVKAQQRVNKARYVTITFEAAVTEEITIALDDLRARLAAAEQERGESIRQHQQTLEHNRSLLTERDAALAEVKALREKTGDCGMQWCRHVGDLRRGALSGTGHAMNVTPC